MVDASIRRLLVLLALFCTKGLADDSCEESGFRNATTTPEVTQGPYHISEALIRSNVTEGQAGIPLTLLVTVRDTQCRAVADAFVEIWHANATGSYSGVVDQTSTAGSANSNTTFLRGMTTTNASGIAELFTIFPGVYDGRAMHVHVGVHIITNDSGSDLEDYEDSYLTHVGQIFFQDALVNQVLQHAPYNADSVGTVTYLANDGVYTGDTNTIGNVTFVVPGSIENGAVLTNEMVVDPMTVRQYRGDYSASNTGQGMMGPGGIAMGPRPGSVGPGGAIGRRGVMPGALPPVSGGGSQQQQPEAVGVLSTAG